MTKTRWTAADLPDMSGRTVVVTGASSGLGAVTAREFARVGARVVLAVRDVAKGQQVAATMPGETEVRALTLTDLASVRAFAAAWRGDLDILINNAGIMQVPRGTTTDHFELQMGTNHLGHFALTNLLLPHITDRVVTVSSNLHRRGRIHLDDLNSERRPYKPMAAYCDSKLANMLFTLELQRRLEAARSRVRSVAAHPGVARTNLLAHVGGVQGRISQIFGGLLSQDPERGALPTLYAATEDVPGGSYIGPDGLGNLRGYPEINKPSPAALDTEMARRLWELSADLTNIDAALPSSV